MKKVHISEFEFVKKAVINGASVYWKNKSYKVIQSMPNKFLIQCSNGNCTGLHGNVDENGMVYPASGLPQDFFIDQ